MLHINNSNKSPSRASSMCTRRHKGMLQTSFILILIVCIGYGFYLYNLLQVKIKYLDTKALRHQSQQQSLSSQLQAVYEDRAKLEKAVQKSKTDLQKNKEEKEAVIQEMLIEHQDKNEALEKENDEIKERNKVLNVDKHDIKQKYDKVYKDHDELKKKHQDQLGKHASQLNEAQGEVEMYQRDNMNMQRLKEDLEQQVKQSKNDVRNALNEKFQAEKVVENTEDVLNGKTKQITELTLRNAEHKKEKEILMRKTESLKNQYDDIKYALRAIPANAVNFDHPAVAKLDENSKQLLQDHLGEADQYESQQHLQDDSRRRDLEQQRQREYVAAQQRQLQNQDGQPQHDERQQEPVNDQQLVINTFDHQHQRQAQDLAAVAETIDICALSPDPGPCRDMGKIRYAYNPISKECRGFMYNGCGGNQNNFQSLDACTDVCNDPQRRNVVKSLTEEQQVHELLNTEEIPDDNMNVNQVIHTRMYGNEEEDDENRNKGIDEEQGKLILEQEMIARREEEEARRELQEQNNNIDQDGNQIDEDPLRELKENSMRQVEVANAQQADMQKLMEQKQNDQTQPDGVVDNIEAQIEDDNDGENPIPNDQINGNKEEEEEEEEEEDEEEEENEMERLADVREREDAQFDLPPAAKIAGDDPEAVMDAPPADHGIDSKDINGRDIYEQERQDGVDNQGQPLDYQADNQQEEDEEEDEDFNQDDPRDGGFGQEEGGREDYEVNDPDKGDDGENEVDNYANEEEDTEEKELHKLRENDRIAKDQHFKAIQGVQNMIPQGANRNREI